ncbi:MAG: hypothetical protein RL469_1368 [Pseudomonadota bacterium]|jgi:phospholipid transport system transporter-binding protein|nr:STAS domain-containing protein [Gammaproteobacteria bacterium]
MTVDFQVIDAAHARLGGELSFATAADALLAGSRWLTAGSGAAAVDCRSLQRADSAGLAVLLEWLAVAARAQRTVSFVNLPESLRQLAAISEVERWLETSPDR